LNRRLKLDYRDVIASESEDIFVSDAVGRISAEIKSNFTLNFPILLYGEEITTEHAELIHRTDTIKVVKEHCKT
jgi:arginine/lysine/ornithine decarboxylase